MIKTKYAYFAWIVILLSTWFSFLFSLWLADGDNNYFFLAIFWLIVFIVVAMIPGANKK